MSSHAAAGHIDHHHDATTTTGIPHKKLFMWAFLASDCMFFGSLIATHLIYRLHPPAGTPDPRDLFSIELTSGSTFILLMSSLLMALAVNSIQKGNVATTRKMLIGTIIFGLIFLGGQVYEFNHFVHVGGLTLNSSVFGSTFYTLTGTHGTHVAIGVLWLVLMYIRTFKPADESNGQGWILKGVFHFIAFTALTVLSMYTILALIHVLQEGHGWGYYFSHHYLSFGGSIILLGVLFAFARQSGPVDFGEAQAIDVESMGLYWHFVDIVWIVIFPVVYLLEYIVLA
ncbi:cytochrome c oxidase subunit 3 [Synoicihabitans lomoniglobus]|uniref:Heme-copper oxidase subunit III n=1 Tax=Synoicihabitans lomoniglobus TaxID=2909285 RepID=A0AAE9ZQB9_9BACT|nr:heme-copper oxidase subunit III [Opitutaceae bacterium LMO-M01]WED63090.1 heme-copper oxidase subunit III [Opitutaceae bacterium LMO-M01]